MEPLSNLALAQAEAVSVDQEVGQVEELRGQLLDVAAIHQAILPCSCNAAKQPVCMVKPATLPSMSL